jgi:ribosomal protein S18 acetylase RimI-like enzyme
MEIREFHPGDGPALRALWRAAGFRLMGDDDRGLAAFAARNPGLFLVADSDGAVIGSVLGAWDGRRGWLYHVTVAPDHRRTGLATELVDRAEAGLKDVGCERALVIVEAENDVAVAFWTARGYELRDTRQLGKNL